MKAVVLGVCLAVMGLILSTHGFAQEEANNDSSNEVSQQRELTRKEKRQMRRALKKLKREILSSEELSFEFLEILNSCKEDDLLCQERLRDFIANQSQGSGLENRASGLMFGICKPTLDSKGMHKVVFSKKEYDCKLSSNGEVYDKKMSRKLYGPGIWWEKQSFVLFCTGAAYGKKMTGFSFAAGAYYGITATSLFGKAGLCLAVGAGKSGGFFVGADRYEFEEL